MSLPRYFKYKDSRAEWLSEVPDHWEVTPLKYLVKLCGGGTPSKINLDYWDGEVPWASAKDLKSESLSDTEDHITQHAIDDGAASLVAAESLLIVVRGMILVHTFPVVKALVPMAINQDLKAVLPTAKLRVNFLAWLLRGSAQETIRRIDEAGHGTKALRIEAWTSMCLPVPPLAEQTLIADFLDEETAKIDALVAEQRRLIELLKEKRQAVISHAVTKGLNPRTPMKPSGIEWIGNVPQHWDYAVLTRIAGRVVVGIAEAATHAYADEGIPILRSTNIRAGRIIGDILFVEPAFAGDRGSKQINAGDLVTVRTGNAGVTAVIPPELDGCQCFTMLITTLNEGSLVEYYCYWMNSISAQCYFSLEGWGTAQVNISVPILKALPVPIPPASEQKAIVTYLDHEIAKLDSLTAEAQRAIDLLQERRTALIAAAVTGKIDVRGLVKSEAA